MGIQSDRIGRVLDQIARDRSERVRRERAETDARREEQQKFSRELERALGIIFSLVRRARQQGQKEYGRTVGAWPGWVHKLEMPGHLWTPQNIERAAEAIGIGPAVLVDLACIVVGSRSVLLEEGLRDVQELGAGNLFEDGDVGEEWGPKQESLCG